MEFIDLFCRLGPAIGHDLLDRFQSCFDALNLSAILCGALGRLLGDQPTHFLFVLKPPPEADPYHREEHDSEDRFDQKRFLKRDDVDDAVIHINLLTYTNSRDTRRTVLSWRTIDGASFAYTSW